tara:strand:+ start:250 stop:534 length:285 start_codon:yes stop_codon:yes gene_type:complete
MKLNAKQKELIKLILKGKGYYKTPMIPKEQSEKNLDDIVSLYLKDVLIFQREYDVDLLGPHNEHKVRFKYYVLTMNKKKTLKDLKVMVKEGKID